MAVNQIARLLYLGTHPNIISVHIIGLISLSNDHGLDFIRYVRFAMFKPSMTVLLLKLPYLKCTLNIDK